MGWTYHRSTGPWAWGRILAPNLPLTESKAAKIGWKYPKRQIFRFFYFWGLKNRFYAQKFIENENSGINNAKNGKKNKNRAGGYFDIRPRTWEVWFWPSLANCPLSAPNYPYVQRVLHGWNRTDLTIPKWYDTWYLGWKMPRNCPLNFFFKILKFALWNLTLSPRTKIQCTRAKLVAQYFRF